MGNNSVLVQKKSRYDIQRIKIFLLYFILLAGGLWHILGVFQETMKLLASPLLIFLGIWLSLEYWKILRGGNVFSQKNKREILFLFWSLFVVAASIFIEWIGVKTGLIFGQYTYGNTLVPKIDGVPIAIGFAWLTMLLSSTGIAQRTFPLLYFQNPYRAAFFTALLMTLFDFFMEPAAMKLNYWNWQDNVVPFHNYVAWFVISYFFALIAFKQNLFLEKMPRITYHAYFAQLLYFLMIFFN